MRSSNGTILAKPRPCGACGEGVFQPANVQGRAFSHRDERNIEITEPLTLPVCTHCGEIRLNAADLERMDAALEREYVGPSSADEIAT